MFTLTLLLLITLFYASYNLLVKVSSDHAGAVLSPPILATISLQLAALSVSTVYLCYLLGKGQSVAISPRAIPWAIAGGICIGLAEILYFVLFRGVGGETPIAASRAIPLIVGGTIAVSVVVAGLVMGERLNLVQWSGVGLAVAGLLILGLSGESGQ